MDASRQNLWDVAAQACAAGEAVCLLIVVDREGSAPNGPGAKLVVTATGARVGTVGGGASEFQLIDRVIKAFGSEARRNETLTLHHYECAPDARSGMICGGSQTYVLLYLVAADFAGLARAAKVEREGSPARLVATHAGLAVSDEPLRGADTRWQHSGGDDWMYEETLGLRDELTIIGAGHVGLALTRVAVDVEFRVTVLDNRPGLGTFEANAWAHAKRIIDYGDVAAHVPEGPRSYVCIMTYGFRPDRDVLRTLLGKPVRYLGMLGSIAKVRAVFRELEAEGISKAALERVCAPLGVPIGSRTPAEIAISIVAELIRARRVGNSDTAN